MVEKLSYIPEDKKLLPQVIKLGDEPEFKKIVIVLGESSVSTHYSLYGHSVNTTPRLIELSKKDNFCFFKNVHSSAPITRDSLSMSLSFHTPENRAPLKKEKSIINLAKDKGFETFWLASQTLEDVYETKYSRMAFESHKLDYTENRDDMGLTSLVDKYQKPGSRQFFILHMAGSHINYKDKSDPEDQEAMPEASFYDLSIHKTDRVLKSLIDYFDSKGEDYALFFTSDHGEFVEKEDHGMLHGGAEQYLVPLLLNTNKNSKKYCSFIESLRHPIGFISGLSNKFIFLKLLGIEVDPNYFRDEISRDRVLHVNGKVYPWGVIEKDEF